MLEKLQIRGFRRVKKIDIVFEPVTTIVGANGKGKSSILGALRWVTRNEPSGDSYINWDMDSAAARAVFEGDVIIRERSSTENFYKLNGETLRSFGVDVPESISSIVKMSDINFHRQHSSPYWFSLTAGEVSRQLNAIVNLSIIDTTSANLQKEQRDTRAIIASTKNEVEKSEQKKEALSCVDRMDKKLEEIENLQKDLENSENEIEQLKALRIKIKHQQRFLEQKDKMLFRANAILDIGNVYIQNKTEIEQLKTLSYKIRDCNKILKRKIPDISGLLEMYQEYQEREKKIQALTQLLNQIKIQKAIIGNAEVDIKNKQKLFDELMGKRCPLCGK